MTISDKRELPGVMKAAMDHSNWQAWKIHINKDGSVTLRTGLELGRQITRYVDLPVDPKNPTGKWAVQAVVDYE